MMKSYFYISFKILLMNIVNSDDARNELTSILHELWQTRSCSNSQRLSICYCLHLLTSHLYIPTTVNDVTFPNEHSFLFPFHCLHGNQVFELESVLDLASCPERLNEIHNYERDELKHEYIRRYLLSRPNARNYNIRTNSSELILAGLTYYLSNPSSYLSEYIRLNSTWYHFNHDALGIRETNA